MEGEELLYAGVGSAGEDYEGGGGLVGLEVACGADGGRPVGGVGVGGWVGGGPQFGQAYGGREGVEVGCAVG